MENWFSLKLNDVVQKPCLTAVDNDYNAKFFLRNALYYSYRSACIGFIFAALYEG